jgi:MFS family permease
MTARGPPERSLARPGAVASLVASLIAMYMISQFLRNSIGVIAPDLASELSLSAVEIGLLSSSFFFAFAAVQLPLGVAIDRFGPKACLLVCAAITVVGAVGFATATSPTALIVARVLLGIGSCSSFMAPLAIYARRFPPQRFATLTGLQLGIGSIGTLLATAPLAFATATIGWRGTFAAVGIITCAAGVLVWLVVTDRPDTASDTGRADSLADSIAGVRDVFRTPSVGRLFVIHLTGYASFAMVVGLWGGPYLTHIYGYDLQARGDLLFVAAVTQILGSLLWGPMDRVFGSHKVPVLVGAGLSGAALAVLAVAGTLGPALLFIWLAAFGFVCAYSPVMVAHGKSLFPPHLVGRGMTVLNVGTIGGVFLAQTLSGVVIELFPAQGGAYPLAAYQAVFGLQAALMLVACVVYAGSHDPLRPGRA